MPRPCGLSIRLSCSSSRAAAAPGAASRAVAVLVDHSVRQGPVRCAETQDLHLRSKAATGSRCCSSKATTAKSSASGVWCGWSPLPSMVTAAACGSRPVNASGHGSRCVSSSIGTSTRRPANACRRTSPPGRMHAPPTSVTASASARRASGTSPARERRCCRIRRDSNATTFAATSTGWISTTSADEWVMRDVTPGPWQSALKGGWWLPGRNRCRPATTAHDEHYRGTRVHPPHSGRIVGPA